MKVTLCLQHSEIPSVSSAGCEFTVMTDHKPLKHLFTSEMRNARVQRWAVMLEEYGCNAEYISGSKNIVADALLRLGPVVEDVKR